MQESARIAEISAKVTGLLFIGPLCNHTGQRALSDGNVSRWLHFCFV